MCLPAIRKPNLLKQEIEKWKKEKGNEFTTFSWELVQDLNKVQSKLMFCPANDAPWMQEKMMQDRIQQQAME